MRIQNIFFPKISLLTVFLVTATILGLHNTSWADESIRVGIFQNKPIVYAENGPKGLFVEVLDYVANKEGWKIEYITCEFSDCLEQLKSNELDLMTSLGVSRSRAKFSTYSKEPIWTFWGTVYAHDKEINSVFDLRDRKVGVRRKNKITSELQKLLNEFNIPVQYVEFDNYENAFERLQDNTIEVVAVNNTYAFDKKFIKHFYKTPIIFSPFSAYFAAPKLGKHRDKLAVIDGYVKDLLSDNSSLIYKFQKKWSGTPESYWTNRKVGIVGVFIFFSTVLIMFFWRYRSTVNLNKQLSHKITESTQLHKEISQRKSEFEAIFNSITDAVVFVDKERKSVLINPSFTKILGYEVEEIIGQTTQKIYANPEEFNEQGTIRYSEEVKNVKPVYEIEYRRKDGTVFPAETLGAQVRDPKGEIIGFLGVIRDISEKKQAEEEKIELENKLLQMCKMEAIGTMAGGIAHDFNNILTSIIGNADLVLLDTPKSHPMWMRLDAILKASLRAKDLVKQILAFSRKDIVNKKPFYFCRLIEESLNTFRSTIPTTIEIKIKIPVKCRENISECRKVLVDSTQIYQLLMNLCINAVHAMDEKGVLEVSVDEKIVTDETTVARPGLEPGIYECLTLSDTGSGMSPEIIEQIFNPFFTTKDVGKGTGMGLSVVYGIVESHNGMIFVDSERGKGTTFHLYFPVTETDPEEELEEMDSLPTGIESILFVDDEEPIVKMFSTILTRLGYKVIACCTSTEALEIFRSDSGSIDLVITDQTMPNLSGIELAAEFLKIRPDIPVILCTGFSTKISEEKIKEVGIRELCMKPLNMTQMAKTVRKVLDENIA